MPLFLIAVFAALGAVWRRAFGGYVAAPRWKKLIAAAVLTLPVFATSAPAWLCCCVTAVITVSWVPGHSWTKPAYMAVRYGTAPLLVAVAMALAVSPWWLLYALCGPAIVGAYWTCQRWNLGAGLSSSFIDGPIAAAELISGAAIYGALIALAFGVK